MKSKHYIIALLMVVCGLSQTILAQTTEEQIMGSWSFDYQASLNSMSQKSKDHFSKMNTSRKNKLSDIYQNRKISFNSDGSYTQVLADGRTTRAFWTINNNDHLEITTPNGRSIQFKIKALQSNSLILSQINTSGGNMNILFTNWHLIKN